LHLVFIGRAVLNPEQRAEYDVAEKHAGSLGKGTA
jgi:hypothetical protein